MNQSLLPNILEFISHIDPFDKLPELIQKQVSASIKITYLAQGEKISLEQQSEDKYLYIVRMGAMEQRKPNGQLRGQLGMGDLFGFTLLVDAKSRGYNTTAIENTLLYMIPHKELKKILEQEPAFSAYFATSRQARLKKALKVTWSSDKGHFLKTAGEVASKKIVRVTSGQSIFETAKAMKKVSCSTAVVFEHERLVGIITDRDMTKRVIATGLDIHIPIHEVMTRSPQTVAPDDLILKAVTIMVQHNVRSLPVVQDGQVHGVLSAIDMIQNHRMQAVYLISDINEADSLEALVSMVPQRQAIFEALIEGGVNPYSTTQVMTLIADAYNRRLLQLAEQQLGAPPCDYAWVVAGSHARFEVHAMSDQDSAVILSRPVHGEEKQYFDTLTTLVCEGLAECGYPTCSGNYMASNPQWCQTLDEWKACYDDWVQTPELEALVNVTVYLDMRAIYGKKELATRLGEHLQNSVESNRSFLANLLQNQLLVKPPLGFFRNFVLSGEGDQHNTLNLKGKAINLIVDLARIYGLEAGVSTGSTEERLNKAFEKGVLTKKSYDNIVESYRFIASVRLKHQLATLRQGKTADNYIDPNTLSQFERNHLKDAFRIISEMQDVLKMRYLT